MRHARFRALLARAVRPGPLPTATTLLITLGGFPADLATGGVLVIGIGMATLLCDWGRRAVSDEFGILQSRNDKVAGQASKTPPGI